MTDISMLTRRVDELEKLLERTQTIVYELLRVLDEDGTIDVDGPDEAGLLSERED